MSVNQLIEALKQFPAEARVCVEVNEQIAAEVVDESNELYCELDNIAQDCRLGNAVKITIV